MAKLYWRVKKQGKWTWTAAAEISRSDEQIIVHPLVDNNQASLEEFGVTIHES